MPPGATTNASDVEHELVQAREERAVLEGLRRRTRLTSCSKGRSTRMPTDSARSGARRPRPSLAACISPGPPPVMMSQPISASAAAARLVSSYANVPGCARAEPKIVTR